MEYLGHSANQSGYTETLAEHLCEVARYAEIFGKPLGIQNEAIFCALLHDLGKMGKDFQMLLQGKGNHIDHWHYGAFKAREKWGEQDTNIECNSIKTPCAFKAREKWGEQGIPSAAAILGHHIGLNTVREAKNLLKTPEDQLNKLAENLKISQPGKEECESFLKSLPIDPRNIPEPETSHSKKPASFMMDIRMLYSILVDSDFLATEGHFRGTPEKKYYTRPEALPLNPAKSFEQLMQFMETIKRKASASDKILSVRNDLMKYALAAAEEPVGNFTLTAPTGSGKTLAMLAFALKHAMKHNLKRIILVIPFLSIIEQTAKIYREVFSAENFPESVSETPFILEDHSQARLALTQPSENEDTKEDLQNLTAENWDAPIVITTNIQFFESLFSNRPGACRKLHRMSESVILFDEVQTLPPDLAIPTLATLGRLCEQYRSTLVMSTATQPAFKKLSKKTEEIGTKWTPSEIVGIGEPDQKKALYSLFDRSRRTKVSILNAGQPVSWKEIAKRMVEKKRCLCIVNLKKHAQRLIDALIEILPHEQDSTPKGLYHLSTSMCPAHRKKTLDIVREELKNQDQDHPVLLVSTQCIEAGVDIDFPALFRAFGPLDSIAQAVGRCNRNQMFDLGEVFLFLPESEDSSPDSKAKYLYPGGTYKRAAEVAIQFINREDFDLDRPEIYDEYFKELYDLGGQLGSSSSNDSSVTKAIKGRDFKKTANEYRLIEEDTINILVDYDKGKYEELVKEVEESGISGDWMRRARNYTITYYRSAQDKLAGKLVSIPLQDRNGKAMDKNNEVSQDWFYLAQKTDDMEAPHYDSLKGLCEKSDDIFMI